MNGAIEQWRKEVSNVLLYFKIFDYPPTFVELHSFIKMKTSRLQFARILQKLMTSKAILSSYKANLVLNNSLINNSYSNNLPRYTLPQYPMYFKAFTRRQKISQYKIKHVRTYVKILSFFPQIKLVGLSGSVAMHNAEKSHDVDLFIITAKNRLFTGRFIALLLAQVIGVRRGFTKIYKQKTKSQENKVCLNLFFDETNLKIAKFKRTPYVGHEILQMKPLVQKVDIYRKLIDANKWVFDIFPNAQHANSKFEYRSSKEFSNFRIFNLFRISGFVLRILFNKIESLLKNFQLFIIRQHQTSEIVTDTQLWFHPDDFERRIRKNKLL